MVEEFNITIASDDAHEKVFAEIYYREKFVALISQEDGPNRLKIEFPSAQLEQSVITREVDLEGFKQALIFASQKLSAGKVIYRT